MQRRKKRVTIADIARLAGVSPTAVSLTLADRRDVSIAEATRERLRAAYEAVPEHQRLFLGDMDTKDGDYKRILYHPERKRQV